MNQANPSDKPILSFKGVRKGYSGVPVLADLSFEIQRGDIVLLLGANGSGKSTLLKMAVGLSRPDAGEISLLSELAGRKRSQAFGYIGHELLLYSELSVAENLRFASLALGLNGEIDQALLAFDLTDQRTKKLGALSKGLKFRVSAARAFLANPYALFFDEPTSSLDDKSFSMLSELISTSVSKSRGAALIATHDLERSLPLATRVLVLNKGKIALDSKELSADTDLERTKRVAVDRYRSINR